MCGGCVARHAFGQPRPLQRHPERRALSRRSRLRRRAQTPREEARYVINSERGMRRSCPRAGRRRCCRRATRCRGLRALAVTAVRTPANGRQGEGREPTALTGLAPRAPLLFCCSTRTRTSAPATPPSGRRLRSGGGLRGA
eukprot:354058-Chlamydomonas_euryale.AAC.11